MQIFRPYQDHAASARYLCDLRLNKQVLECAQVTKSILIQMGLAEGKGGYFRHPITQNIWNNGTPYLPDLCRYMAACDHEWIRRGKKRSPEFTAKMNHMRELINAHSERFIWEEMPPYFVSGDTRETDTHKVFVLYQKLLHEKWETDKRPPKASLSFSSQKSFPPQITGKKLPLFHNHAT
ncbi:pyrimidine dimer DNA glycosylase/endonuclease V [Aneurinibacillus sp. REN35]|uniref:pyrimidine dimer DNA glycosylase/endonuclease V n=1 Tax=Aneurinibacillus sp. REN35 TaxID=3237286 RepID=UPI003529AE84